MSLKFTPLHSEHLHAQARMVEFAGFDMPISYDRFSGGMMQEHLKVRQFAGMFDVSHMGEFLIEGTQATAFLTSATTKDFSSSKDGRAYYSLLLRKDGGIVDDIIVYRFSEEKYWMVVNASNIEKDWTHLNSLASPFSVQLTDLSSDTALIAVQGPKAAEIIEKLYPGSKTISYYGFQELGQGRLLSRTGYTGEDGFEIFLPASAAIDLWRILLKNDVAPIGLGARDTLRMEVGFPLYGQELREDLYPQETLAAFAVRNSQEFFGKQSLQHKARWRPVALLGNSPKPMRPKEKILLEGRVGGELTSGSTSPILRRGMGLGLIEASCPLEDHHIFMLESGGKQREATLTLLPFVETTRVKKKSEF